MILVTGGAGFIGSNFIIEWRARRLSAIVNLDKLIHSCCSENLSPLANDNGYLLVKGDINDQPLVARLLRLHRPRAVVHFAAETHVDHSIRRPADFIHSNVLGTLSLVEAVRAYLQTATAGERAQFRFLHVSTDEVYGSVAAGSPAPAEGAAYAPTNPYSASKAAADHLVRAFHHTYGLPSIITHSSNNYGPRQSADKLIPLMTLNALAGRRLPVYGDGLHCRDWLSVHDHCTALRAVLERGLTGETYNIGSGREKTNLAVVRAICDLVDEMQPDPRGPRRSSLIEFVTDRPGHDRRYAMDTQKIRTELDWEPEAQFDNALRDTVAWYLARARSSDTDAPE